MHMRVLHMAGIFTWQSIPYLPTFVKLHRPDPCHVDYYFASGKLPMEYLH